MGYHRVITTVPVIIQSFVFGRDNPKRFQCEPEEMTILAKKPSVKNLSDDQYTTTAYPVAAMERSFEVTTSSAPHFHGQNRLNCGQCGWWDIDNKDHKTWKNRRRGTGLQRAPKWQQLAGGGKKARQTIRRMHLDGDQAFTTDNFITAHAAL